ncbi:MAG: anion transporter [Burkholderiales bacterium]|nr:anion transporter [Burkholderiales bacterium]MDE1927201.1 anion transporter [Burkholderiales bacterium]MDE2505007.1 anion transporter [Burkholderiales bacterium]
MTPVLIFGLVYLGMILGGLPGLQLDRTDIALLGAIAVIGSESLSVDAAARSIHLPTLILLFSFMVVSAQMRLGGFYDRVTERVAALPLAPPALLAALVALIGVLSAVFTNDVVCLAVAPVLIGACRRRSLDPVPFLLALAAAANVGSAATLIGNPQNMLIGQKLGLSFAGYAATAAPPVVAGLIVTWGLVALGTRRRWTLDAPAPAAAAPEPYDRWQSAKGLAVAAGLLLAFVFAPWPREVVALAGAGALLLSRRLHSSRTLGLVDWNLLVLFIGLFVVNGAFEATGLPAQAVAASARAGLPLNHPAALFGAAFALSNIVSNVPAVMLLLPVSRGAVDGPLLALVSTLAGNLFVVGSIANIIVVDAAARQGVRIGWRRHAALGLPLTLATLALTAGWLALRAA